MIESEWFTEKRVKMGSSTVCIMAILKKCANVRSEKPLEVGDEEVIIMANTQVVW